MTETALNMPESMHSYLTQTPELSADTIVWLTKEKREWYASSKISPSIIDNSNVRDSARSC